jgi:hypothetical protein
LGVLLRPSKFWRAVCFLHPFTILALNYSDSRGYDESTNSSAFYQILLLIARVQLSQLQLTPTDYLGLNAAIEFDTVLQALLHVAIAPVYFFFELLEDS